MLCRRWQGANQVNVDVGKTLGRDRYVEGEEVDMAVGFGGVAGGAGAAPAKDVSGEVRPDIAGRDKAARSTAARVGEAMEVLEKKMAQRLWDQWSENAGGDVAVELVAGDGVRGNGEGGGMEELLCFRAGELLLCKREGREIRWWGEGRSGRQRRRGWGGLRWAGQGVGDGVGSARSVGCRDGEFGNEGQLALLAARLWWGKAVEGGQEGLVVSEEGERAALQVSSEVEEGRINSQELPVKSGVFLLGRGEFGGIEGEGHPVGTLALLEDSANVGVGGVCGEAEGRGRVRVDKESGTGEGRLGGPESSLHGRCPGEGARGAF